MYIICAAVRLGNGSSVKGATNRFGVSVKILHNTPSALAVQGRREREKGRKRERERKTEKTKKRDKERERKRERERESKNKKQEREREREREKARERERERKREREREASSAFHLVSCAACTRAQSCLLQRKPSVSVEIMRE